MVARTRTRIVLIWMGIAMASAAASAPTIGRNGSARSATASGAKPASSRSFPTAGPPVKWRTPIGEGYSGPAVAQGKVIITDRILAKGAKNPDNAFDKNTPRRRQRTRPVPGRGHRQDPVEARIRLRLQAQLCFRAAHHAGHRRGQGLHARSHGRSVLPRSEQGQRHLVEEPAQGIQDGRAALGLCRPSARRRRPAHLPGRRQGERGRRFQQGHRQGNLAGPLRQGARATLRR